MYDLPRVTRAESGSRKHVPRSVKASCESIAYRAGQGRSLERLQLQSLTDLAARAIGLWYIINRDSGSDTCSDCMQRLLNLDDDTV